MGTNRRGIRWSSLLFTLLFPLTAVAVLLQATPAASLSSSPVSPLDVAISEIAWMGTTTDNNDEWLELANNTASDIALSGWQLVSSDGTPAITLSGILPANGRYLLERTDDTSTPILADRIYTGSLADVGEVLTLTDSLSNVIDIANAPGAWFAGSNATKATMERTALTSSGSLVGSWSNGPVNGTPTNSMLDGDSDSFGYSPNIDWIAGGGPGYGLSG